jgi:oxygen-independent coproporphyrinogen-3 oxidase
MAQPDEERRSWRPDPALPKAVLDELLGRYDVPAPRYTSYPTADRWSPWPASEHAGALSTAGLRPESPLSIYVHLPFCRSLCLYCGCNVVVARQPDVAERYLGALEREMDLVLEKLGDRRDVAQLHWGGGTPTFLQEAQLQRLHRAITSRFRLLPQAEVAIEVDPRVTTPGQLRVLRDLGFSRLSLGVQDLSPEVQEAIGRHQTTAQTETLVQHARQLGFATLNFDLVYGLPRQTPERWQRTLEHVVALGPDRVATYSFAHVPTLRPQQRRLPVAEIPTGAAKLQLLLAAQEHLGAAGYLPIGMDHFARASDELGQAQQRATLQRNFQGYTVMAAPDVVALGVSAISDLGGEVFAQNAHALRAYYQAIEHGELATTRGLRLSPDDQRRRALIAALMCDLRAELSADDLLTFQPELAALAPLVDDGLVDLGEDFVEVTALGRLFLRNIAMTFDAYRSREAVPAARSRTI